MIEQEIHDSINSIIITFVKNCVESSGKIKVSQAEYDIKSVKNCQIDNKAIEFPDTTEMLTEEKFVVSSVPKGSFLGTMVKMRNSNQFESKYFEFWIKDLALKYNKETKDIELIDEQEAEVFFSIFKYN